MKKLLLLLLLIISNLDIVKGQSMLTVGDVYDYNINDEFQSKVYNVPPNASRIKIIEKHFSTNNDTVFYIRHFDNYSTTVDMTTSPPHLDSTFSIGYDSVFYTNLNSLINSYFILTTDSCTFFHDTLYYSNQFCSELVYEYAGGGNGYCDEGGDQISEIYGKGLGLVYHHYAYPSEGFNEEIRMFYYKKDTIICGTPDTAMALSISEYRNTKEKVVLYPNPATNYLNVTNITHRTTIRLFDVFGKIVMERKIEGNTKLDINDLAQGIYTLVAEDRESRSCYKVIITKE